jgi:hypothetical protein
MSRRDAQGVSMPAFWSPSACALLTETNKGPSFTFPPAPLSFLYPSHTLLKAAGSLAARNRLHSQLPRRATASCCSRAPSEGQRDKGPAH